MKVILRQMIVYNGYFNFTFYGIKLHILTCVFFLETAIPTIPSHACAVSYGQYNDLKIAKFACTHDDKCTSIVDEKCDQVGPYQACGKQYPETAGISSTCNDSPVKEEGN